jgi:leucyl aminopeptidase
MLAKLEQAASPPTAEILERARHVLMVLPRRAARAGGLRGLPFADTLARALARRRKKAEELAKSPLATDLPQGGLAAWVVLDVGQSAFEQLTAARKALQLLLSEKPESVTVAVFGSAGERRRGAEIAVFAAWVNGARLPERKKEPEGSALGAIRLHGYRSADGFATQRAIAAGNTLCRELTVLPPNELNPAAYRKRVRALAREQGWRHEEYDMRRLRKMGAGAFVAVAQGSAEEDAAIVHLAFRGRGARKRIALVGKGICFDTGGHNLKSARYMHGMHEDMNGSAVALGILLAASELRLPLELDCWMAIAQNHLSPRAYRQNEVVAALNGTTIEIVHTDAEGRMVLADALALAARATPSLIVDFATLTGSMRVALGDRYSGIFATSGELVRRAVAAGETSGERVNAFPLDADYDAALESPLADVKQCSLEGHADHILATRFLKRFVGETPWIHMDLSGSSCKGGLGGVATDVTGFGVAWGVELLRMLLGRAR